jgi:muramoyltetrapeptide carboxypeptidase
MKGSYEDYKEQKEVIKPSRLKIGEEIRIIAPSSYPEIIPLSQSAEEITKLGYRVTYGINVKKLNQDNYHSANPELRAKELMDAFTDDNVKAIFCARGGHGARQTLPFLDFDVIREHPKIFMGYSDITNLHMAINKLSGLVTFHGPMPDTDTEEFRGEKLEIMFRIFRGELSDLKPYIKRLVKYVVEGSAQGRSMGTNMSVFSSLTGTPYMPEFNGKVLFCEDTNERSVDIERYLDIMTLNGTINQLSGFVFGEFKNRSTSGEGKPSIEDVIKEYMVKNAKPSLAMAPFGHGNEQMLIPLNLRVRITESEPYIEPMESMVE